MKKLLYLLLALPFAFMAASCSDDDKDLPDVNVTMTFDNAAEKDGIIYVAESDTLKITNIVTKAVDSNNNAAITNVAYYWNYYPAPGLTWSNLPINIPMKEMPLVESGYNVLGMDATVLEVDKSIAYCYIRVPIKAVKSAEEFPDGLQPGTAVYTIRIGQSKTRS